ncbi:MAG TPA: DUF6046 domain-containing protein [Paludibacter sp.]
MNNKDYQFNEFDLQNIFKSVWGYAAFPFLFALQNKVEKKLFGKTSDSEDYSFDLPAERRVYNIKGSPFYGLNNNGNEIFLPIWLIKSDGTKFLLQNTVASIVNKKTIVETPLVNQQGSVKEEISMNDWDINVKGIIVSPDSDYPDQQVLDLKELYKSGESLEIENARTSLLFQDNERVVIRSFKLPEIKGMKNVQAFEMDITSDIEFKLIIE